MQLVELDRPECISFSVEEHPLHEPHIDVKNTGGTMIDNAQKSQKRYITRVRTAGTNDKLSTKPSNNETSPLQNTVRSTRTSQLRSFAHTAGHQRSSGVSSSSDTTVSRLKNVKIKVLFLN